MASHTGATFFTFEDKFYSLFPFVDGRHLPRGTFSPRAIKATARMLAQIHQAGKAAPLAGQRSMSTERPDAQFVQSAEQILRLIPRQGRSAFDELAEQGLQLKLRLMQQFNNPGPMLDRNDDHLIHGDYQDGNLFFTEGEMVKAVFDWEKCSIAPRELELVRTIEFICFSNPHDYHAVFSAANYERARIFLSHYHVAYAVPRERFSAAVRARYLTQMHSLWVETEHYLVSNQRVDLFLETGLRTLQFYAEHLEQHIDQLCKGILP
jgi:Ser/Thr protein kinase RdoA (MazF antagonist)